MCRIPRLENVQKAKTYEICHTVCVFAPPTLHFVADFKQVAPTDNFRVENSMNMLLEKLAVLMCLIQIEESLQLRPPDPPVRLSLSSHHVQI